MYKENDLFINKCNSKLFYISVLGLCSHSTLNSSNNLFHLCWFSHNHDMVASKYNMYGSDGCHRRVRMYENWTQSNSSIGCFSEVYSLITRSPSREFLIGIHDTWHKWSWSVVAECYSDGCNNFCWDTRALTMACSATCWRESFFF